MARDAASLHSKMQTNSAALGPKSRASVRPSACSTPVRDAKVKLIFVSLRIDRERHVVMLVCARLSRPQSMPA